MREPTQDYPQLRYMSEKRALRYPVAKGHRLGLISSVSSLKRNILNVYSLTIN